MIIRVLAGVVGLFLLIDGLLQFVPSSGGSHPWPPQGEPLAGLIFLAGSGTVWALLIRDARRGLAAQDYLNRGHCPACGYDRAGLSANAACPECGASP